MLHALGSQHWDVLTVLRIPESCTAANGSSRQLLKNIVNVVNGNSSPPVPVLSYIY